MSAFDRHEKSELHRPVPQLIPNQRTETVLELSHKQKMEVMKENRVALEKIFTSSFGKKFEISRMPRFGNKRERRS